MCLQNLQHIQIEEQHFFGCTFLGQIIVSKFENVEHPVWREYSLSNFLFSVKFMVIISCSLQCLKERAGGTDKINHFCWNVCFGKPRVKVLFCRFKFC